MIKSLTKTFDDKNIEDGTQLKLVNNRQVYEMVGYTTNMQCVLIPTDLYKKGLKRSGSFLICEPEDIEGIIPKKSLFRKMSNEEYIEILVSSHGG